MTNGSQQSTGTNGAQQETQGARSDGRGQTALLTGASSGIGLELARLFARDGYRLVLVADDTAKLNQATQELGAISDQPITTIVQDLAEVGAAHQIADRLAAQGTEIDVLVNDAGIGTYGQFIETDLEEETRLLHINIVAPTQLTKRLLPGMVARKRGRILNLASVASFMPGPLMTVYYASKAYVLSFSEGLAEEVRGSGVTVTALCPGPTETGFQQRAAMEESRLVKGVRLQSAADVAKAGYAGMLAGKTVVIPSWSDRVTTIAPRFVPRAVVPRLVRRAQESDR